MPSTGQIYEKMPLQGNLALYRNDRQMHRGGAQVRLELTRPRRWKPTRILVGLCVAFFRLAEIRHFLFSTTEKMGTIALAHDLSSRHPFLINFSKLLLGPEVSFNRKLNCGLQAVYNGREAELRNIPVFFKEFLSDPS